MTFAKSIGPCQLNLFGESIQGLVTSDNRDLARIKVINYLANNDHRMLYHGHRFRLLFEQWEQCGDINRMIHAFALKLLGVKSSPWYIQMFIFGHQACSHMLQPSVNVFLTTLIYLHIFTFYTFSDHFIAILCNPQILQHSVDIFQHHCYGLFLYIHAFIYNIYRNLFHIHILQNFTKLFSYKLCMYFDDYVHKTISGHVLQNWLHNEIIPLNYVIAKE